MLETLHKENSKFYWKWIDKLQGTENINWSEAIDPSTWASHFQNLNQPKLKFA